MSHRQPRTHKTHHGPNLVESTTFPLIVYFVPLHEAHIQMAFCRGTPKNGSLEIPKVGSPVTLWPITLFANIRLRWSLKQSYSFHQKLSNGVLHVTCMQVNRVNSRLLVLGKQIANLTPGFPFNHNLCFKCPNGSCETILNIYVSIAFHWYKELFDPMGFDPYNRSLKIWKSIETPTPKVRAHLGVWGFIPSHSLALPGAWNVTPGLPSWPMHSQALALITNPKLGLRHGTCSSSNRSRFSITS
jgi:hypothetical protein